MTGTPIRILIVDDHFIVRMGLRGVLNMQPDMQVVAECAEGAEAARAIRRPSAASASSAPTSGWWTCACPA